MDVEQELQHIEEQYQRGSLTGDQYTAQRAALLGQLVPLGTFGAYHLLKELGSNSRGTTWLARHRTPHKAHEQGGEVILKTLDPRLANNAAGARDSGRLRNLVHRADRLRVTEGGVIPTLRKHGASLGVFHRRGTSELIKVVLPTLRKLGASASCFQRRGK